MLTVGIDLAAAEQNTGVAWLCWAEGRARVDAVRVGAVDEELVRAMLSADKTGVDCPLGWPLPFVDFVTRHRDGHVQAAAHEPAVDWRRRLAYRRTDLHVRRVTGLQPLSVSTDRIGVTTMRCAALLASLAANDAPVDRAGEGAVVEVYPAASLRRWGFTSRGYKRVAGTAVRDVLVDQLLRRAPWLSLGRFEQLCRHSDDALDAVLAAMTARAAASGQVEPLPRDARRDAVAEGWVALPDRTLDELPR